MARMVDSDRDHQYSVAWIDCLARGHSLGRSILMRGRHARIEELTRRDRGDPLRCPAGLRLAAPPWSPSGLLNRWTAGAFNALYYRLVRAAGHGSVQSIRSFFHPLDAVDGWNRLYGRRGFLQYQLVVPFGAEATVRLVLERLSGARCASFLAVLKRFGEGDPGPLSFPLPGWTLALDAPARTPGLAGLLDGLDELVAGAGGRVYLAKDSRLRAELLPAMYPDLARWQKVRGELDPDLQQPLRDVVGVGVDHAAGGQLISGGNYDRPLDHGLVRARAGCLCAVVPADDGAGHPDPEGVD
jgi:decaprenylphospho-beta-D-ribofuranose 2-oxidase